MVRRSSAIGASSPLLKLFSTSHSATNARPVGGSGYNIAVAEPRDEFPNNFVGDLVHAERGWVVVPPTCCPDCHDYSDGGWSVNSVWAPATTVRWRGAVGAASRSMRRSRGCTAESAKKGPFSMSESNNE